MPDQPPPIDLARDGVLLPPAEGLCQQCAYKHEPGEAHNQLSLFWQYWFYGEHGRWPVWADAIAHCDEKTRAAYKRAFREYGLDLGTTR